MIAKNDHASEKNVMHIICSFAQSITRKQARINLKTKKFDCNYIHGYLTALLGYE